MSKQESFHNNGVRSGEEHHIQIKMPNYFSNSTNWFAQVDAAFELSNIRSSKTKYFHLLTSLPPDLLELVSYEMDPLAESPYEKLKASILQKTTMSTIEAMNKLMNFGTEPYKKPSRKLSEMKQLFKIIEPQGNPEKSNIMRLKFLESLPKYIRHHLVQHKDKSLDEIAQLADHHVEMADQDGEINEIKQLANQYDESAINSIREEINSIKTKQRQIIDKISSEKEICYFHRKFGRYARKCQSPCSFNSGKGNGSQ